MQLEESEWADKESTVEQLKDGRWPVVFAFRPTKLMRVAPDKLGEWEELFAKNVGMKPDRDLARMWSDDPRETISGSNGDWDDCDYA